MRDLEQEKRLAATRAVAEVRPGMLVGLGTGSTAAYAVRALGCKIREQGLRITATATSQATEVLARAEGIPVVPFEEVSQVDLTIDGADEVTPELEAIKGGGGALLREKIVASASTRVIIIVDSSKLVQTLGRFKLPVEVLPFAAAFVERRLLKFGVPVVRRTGLDGSPSLTDQGAYIFDLRFGVIQNPLSLARGLDEIPGVLEHGLFLSEIDEVYVGNHDAVDVLSRKSVSGR